LWQVCVCWQHSWKGNQQQCGCGGGCGGNSNGGSNGGEQHW
jgi:hypothetical protein